MKIFVKKRYASLHHKTKFIELKGAKLIKIQKKHPHTLYFVKHACGYVETYFDMDIRIEEV